MSSSGNKINWMWKVTREPILPLEGETQDPGGCGSTSLGPISVHPFKVHSSARCRNNKSITQLRQSRETIAQHRGLLWIRYIRGHVSCICACSVRTEMTDADVSPAPNPSKSWCTCTEETFQPWRQCELHVWPESIITTLLTLPQNSAAPPPPPPAATK